MACSFHRVMNLVSRFRSDQRGATAIEYSMIAAGIAGAVILTVYALGSTVETNFYGKLVGSWN